MYRVILVGLIFLVGCKDERMKSSNTLPRECSSRIVLVKDLSEGETGYVSVSSMLVDKDHNMWLWNHSPIYTSWQKQTAYLIVRKTNQGLEVTLHGKTNWHISRGEVDENYYNKVAVLHYDSKLNKEIVNGD